ncbi:MAG: tRNA (guanosine(46)-N7)-methyltransferase TrmB [Lachnospiraceae bacterium]|nr:tRNA (guanosine(46)-N7)-methyltransferase TrmB [Lachnospiraceae bacterium]
MRLRNIRGARERIQENDYAIKDPENYKGKWREEVFHNNNPLHIEIGMGKGKFIIEMARRNPYINYIGIERYSSVLIRALEKMEEEELENVRFLRFDAENLETIFDQGEINQIYLNFSDPWPKDRHAKRRLTSERFLGRYDKVLKAHAPIEFKTDNRPLFDFSVEEAQNTGWTLDLVTYDLHHSEYAEGNVMTEYEERFSQMGNPICKLIMHH